VRPPTPPPEFDVPAWDRTIARMRALKPRRLLLTHFGAHEWADELLVQLQDRLHAWVAIVRQAVAAGDSDQRIVERVRDAAEQDLAGQNQRAGAKIETIMAIQQSAMGMIRYVKTREMPTSEASPRRS
jgi:hypothetical protein